MWRESARWLEDNQPPITGVLPAPVTLRSGDTIPVDIARPFHSHALRFANTNGVSWMDRLDPGMLTEILPQTFLGIWCIVLILDWVWYLFLR